jgi:hypothetical protein
MLRGFVLAVAVAALAGGLLALLWGACPPAFVFGGWGLLILIGTVYERVRYKPVLKQPPGSGWQRTDERFIDPSSGRPVTVYLEPVWGERQYVQE